MRTPSARRAKPNPGFVTVTLQMPVLDDATAVMVYNCLCELVDRFDSHYGEQICRFYNRPNPIAVPLRTKLTAKIRSEYKHLSSIINNAGFSGRRCDFCVPNLKHQQS